MLTVMSPQSTPSPQRRTPTAQRPLTLILMAVALAAVLALALLPAHTANPWLPSALALLALLLVGVGVLRALNGLTQAVQTGMDTQTDMLASLLAAPAQAIATQSAELATQAGRLAQQGDTWQRAVEDLRTTQHDFLAAQREAEDRHEEQIQQLFRSYQESLASFAEEAKHQQAEARAEAQRFTLDLQRRQTELLTSLLEQLGAQFTGLQREQADTVQRLTESALAQFGETLERRVAGIESQATGALQTFQTDLPPAVRDSIQQALAGAVDLVDMVREQAGTLAQTMSQVGQNADRQVQAYNQWANRIADWQLRLDQTLTAAQAAQAELLAGWQQRADQSLSRIDQTLGEAAEANRKGQETMAQAIAYFGQRVVTLEGPLKSLLDQINALHPPLLALGSGMTQLNAPLAANAGALDGLNGSTTNLTRALTIAAMSEQQRFDQAEKLTAAYTQSMSAALQRLNETVQVLSMTLQTLQRAADKTRP
jgi:hypothetical protein